MLLQRQVRARVIVIGAIAGKNASQMRITEDHEVIQALALDRADQTFGDPILPWRPGTDRAISDPHRSDPGSEDMAVGPVVVAN
jgi:hypothetical protein